MISLSKQIFKSLKNSVLLLFGLIFVCFIIVFASTSSLYFSSNINHSYKTLLKESKHSDVVVDISNNNLKNDNLKNSLIYDVFFKYGLPNWEKPEDIPFLKKPNEKNLYFDNVEDYRNYKDSFMYQPARLSKSKFFIQSLYGRKGLTYLYPYFDGNINENGQFLKEKPRLANGELSEDWDTQVDPNKKNKWFQNKDINNKDKKYLVRPKAILSSYGDLDIPDNPTYWRFNGLQFIEESNPEDILYEIDPLTGLTQKPNEFGLINSKGVFSKGVLKSSFKFKENSLTYPKNIKRATIEKLNDLRDKEWETAEHLYYTTVVGHRFFQTKAENGVNKGKYIDTPLFISRYIPSYDGPNDDSIRSTFQYDIKPYLEKGEIINKFKNGVDLFNLVPSYKSNFIIDIPIKDINWNLASVSPYYDYLKILHNWDYLTESKTSTFSDKKIIDLVQKGSTFNTKNYERENLIDQNDYIFNIHIDESKLNYSQIQTLKYVKENYPEEYDKLSRFIFAVNAKWVKKELISKTNDLNIKNEINKTNLDSFDNLIKPFQLTPTTYLTPIEIVMEWLLKEANSNQKIFLNKISKYQKEYLGSKLNKQGIKFNFQKSFTITDNKSNNNFLISQKDNFNDDFNSNWDLNKLYITSGTKLKDSKQYLDLANNLFKPFNIKNLVSVEDNPYPETNGKYLINLISFFNKSKIDGLDEKNSKYKEIKKALKEILDSSNLGFINGNKYNWILSIINPDYTLNQNENLLTDDQGLRLLFYLNRGINSASNQFFATISAPYSKAAIVTKKWLEANNKKIVNPEIWKEVVNFDDEKFSNWMNNLPDEYKFSINFKNFVILGVGQTAENAYPLVSLDKKVINLKTDSLVFVNKLGYNAILSTLPSSVESEYFSIKLWSNQNTNKSVNLINRWLFSDFVKSNAYFLGSNNSLLSLRFIWPQKLNYYIQIFTLIFTLILICIGIYLLILIIKMYIEKNQISLSIIKANGFPTWKIILSISILGLFIGLISSPLGYILGYFTQSLFINIISNYWVIPINIHLFSISDFILSFIIIYCCFFVFTSIWMFFLLNKPINDLVSRNTEGRINKFLFIIKSSKFSLPVQIKFRLALSLNKIGKYFLFVVLSSFILSFLSIAMSIPIKFRQSINNTYKNKDYFYSFDLQTPNEQSGLYKVQDERFLGTSDEKNGISNIYAENIISRKNQAENPYVTLWNNYDNKNFNQLSKNNDIKKYKEQPRDLFALRNLDGTIRRYGPNNEIKYFTNFLLANFVSFQDISESIDFLKNSVLIKWLVDFDINVLSFNVNVWNVLKDYLGDEIANHANLISDTFVKKMLEIKQIKKLAEIGNGRPEKPLPFFKNVNGNFKLIFENIITPIGINNLSTIRFNDNFMKFIGIVYGEGYEKINFKDVKVSFGILPQSNDTEKYTYINAKISNPKIKLSFLYNKNNSKFIDIPIKIYGIKNNSKFIKMLNNENDDITHLLDKKVDDKYYPIIINNGAALKYNLKINDTFNSKIENTYDRFSKKIYNEKTLKEVKFKVVGISSDSFNLSFYTSQKFANEILGLDFNEGALLFKDFTRRRRRVEFKGDIQNNFSSYKLSAFGKLNSISNTSGEYNVNIDENIPNNYVPFNGVFSKEKENISLIINQSYYSTSGFYGTFSGFLSDKFKKIAATTAPFIIFNKIIPFEKTRINKLKAYLKNRNKDYKWTNNDREDIINFFTSIYDRNNESLWRYLDNIFSNKTFGLSVIESDAFNKNLLTFSSFFSTFLTIQNIVIGLILPIIIMVILIISSVMITEFKKILAILKTLGYSDKRNLKSIFLTFIPVLFVSLLIGILVMYFSIFFMQALMFNATSIFLSTTLNWLPYMYGVIGIFLVMIINFVYITIYLKKQNLKNVLN